MSQSQAFFLLDQSSGLVLPEPMTAPVRHGVDIFCRDFEKVLGAKPRITAEIGPAAVVLRQARPGELIYGEPERFQITFTNPDGPDAPVMTLSGSDELGLIYGLLYLSREYLGIDPFWFWTDQVPSPKEQVAIPIREYVAPERKVRYRGWFVNDEVCLIGWTDDYPPPREVWFPVFESLLRCGGNLVIPGTDLPKTGIHWNLASEMGLYITHHHAEPLGAEMFFRTYPHQEASYDRNRVLFEGLWEEAILKKKDHKVIWTLGFRGQGDCPFWEQDPSRATPERRGQLISQVIRRQYEMVARHVANPVCSTYLYGEIAELYRDGYIDIPDGIIKIWSDNGYGKMVSRRQGNHNPRVPSLPAATEAGPHGLYYHVTFHDLQASNHLTMFPGDPRLIREELRQSFQSGCDRLLLLNCGNIKPHIYPLEIVSGIWNDGDIDPSRHLEIFCGKHFGPAGRETAQCYRDYFTRTVAYGAHSDERAGEEYYHHPARAIISHWMRGLESKTAETLLWATGDQPFPEQVRHFHRQMAAAAPGWAELDGRCRDVASTLGTGAVFFGDHLLLQVKLHESGCRGFLALCQSYFAYRADDFPLAFVYASQALWDYGDGLKALEAAEHGRWRNFYRADWLTNIQSTRYSLDALRKFLRMHGDSPDFFWWHKQFLMPESEKKIYLENTHRNPLSDDELARKLKAKLLGIPIGSSGEIAKY
jgi:hypothetical protein